MYGRLEYAFGKTRSDLRAVFAIKIDYEIILAIVVTLIGFWAIQLALDYNTSNIFIPFIVGGATAAIFFLGTVGFVTFISIVFVFAYGLTIGQESGTLTGWARGWRIMLSFLVAGFLTAAAFNLFSEGLKELRLVGINYIPLFDAGY